MSVRGKRAKSVHEKLNPPTPHLDTPREWKLASGSHLVLRKLDAHTAQLVEESPSDPDGTANFDIDLDLAGLRWLRAEIDAMIRRIK